VITISRRLYNVIPYRLVWFPTEAALESMATELSPAHLARVEFTTMDAPSAPCTIIRNLSLTLWIDLRPPLEQIFGRFDATARKKVRRTERLGSRINVRRYHGEPTAGDPVGEFVELYNRELVQHKGGKVFPIPREQIKRFLHYCDLFMIDLDDKLVMGRLCMRDPEGGKVRQLYAANRRFDDPESARLAANLNVYLHWYELQRYREEGFTTYDLGGINPLDDPGINRFKLQFGGELVRLNSYLFAGAPAAYKVALAMFSTFVPRGNRRHTLERAGDRWQDMSLDQIRDVIEAGAAAV
jgi:hypothetical protein